MPASRRLCASIICAIVLALCGCSAVRLGYNAAPQLAYWFLDPYFDWDGAQSLRVKSELQNAHDWHRTQELPLLIDVLRVVEGSALEPVDGGQVCALYDVLKLRVRAVAERLLPLAAELAPTLKAAQLETLAREYEKRNRNWRDEWLDGGQAASIAHSYELALDRAETFYGELSKSQRTLLQRSLETSSIDSSVQYREILRRQQDSLQTLRRIQAAPIPSQVASTELQGLLNRSLNSPDPVYAAYFEKVRQEACAAVSKLHASTTPSQRSKLLKKLQDYESDARTLNAQR